MTALDLTRLKALAQAVGPGRWEIGEHDDTVENYTPIHSYHEYGNHTNFAQVITSLQGELSERCVARARFIVEAQPAVVLELIARLERAEAGLRMLAGAMPNDPLDDVLPLPAKAGDFYKGPLAEPFKEQSWIKPLPLNLPASLELPAATDTTALHAALSPLFVDQAEGGSHG